MSGDKGNIVVVDDDRLLVESLCYLLVSNGYRALGYVKPREALAACRADPPDVLLSDFNMPEMNGIRLAEEVGASGEAISVILITSYADLDLAISAFGIGVENFLIKPFLPEKLLEAIGRGVEKKRCRDACRQQGR